jgi:hypothetical protein
MELCEFMYADALEQAHLPSFSTQLIPSKHSALE